MGRAKKEFYTLWQDFGSVNRDIAYRETKRLRKAGASVLLLRSLLFSRARKRDGKQKMKEE